MTSSHSLFKPRWLSLALAACALVSPGAQSRTAQLDWPKIEGEALDHYQALLRFDTTATERAEAEYLKRVLDEQGIPARILATDPERPNVVARLKGSGRKRPLLLMGHLDTVPVDASKWKFPPFSATRDGGFVYGRGAIDDKDNLAAALMTMLLLKRQNVALDRDVILLAESGEESAQQLGLGFMVAQHYPEIDAEFCIAEGGDTIRERGEVRYAAVQVTEKVVRGVELTAHGISGHGSVPLTSNPIAHLGNAVGKFRRLAARGQNRRDDRSLLQAAGRAGAAGEGEVLPRPAVTGRQDGECRCRLAVRDEPRHASMARTSVSPTIFNGGYRSNVIPSEAKARLDVRMLPDENPDALLAQIKKAINDPAVDVQFAGGGASRPPISATRLDSDLYITVEAAVQRVYRVQTLPSMSTYATDMWPLRARGMQCVGIGAGVDLEDQSIGWDGMHSTTRSACWKASSSGSCGSTGRS